jgi:hypothetical protein
MLDGLARLVGGTGTRIERVLAEDARSLPWGTTVVVVTSNVTDGLQLGLLALSRRGARPVLIACGDTPVLANGLLGRIAAYHVPADNAGKERADGFEPVAITG